MANSSDMSRLASLARLAPSLENLTRFDAQCQKILQYMDTLQQADTQSVEPMYTPFEGHGFMRADCVNQRDTQEDILANSPSDNIDYFVVPRIL